MKTDKLYHSGKEDEGKTFMFYMFSEWMKICGIEYVDKVAKLEKGVNGRASGGSDTSHWIRNDIMSLWSLSSVSELVIGFLI